MMESLLNNLISKSKRLSLLDDTRLRTLESGINNIKDFNLTGDIFDLGVYRGGSSLFLKSLLLKNRLKNPLRLFDTFNGLADKSEFDIHNIGDIRGDSYEDVKKLFGKNKNVFIYKGIIPDTFKGLEDRKISLSHIDVDNFNAVKDSLEFIYPRMEKNGLIILDDHNCKNCPGAKKATDEFMEDKPEKLIFPHEHDNPQVYFVKL